MPEQRRVAHQERQQILDGAVLFEQQLACALPTEKTGQAVAFQFPERIQETFAVRRKGPYRDALIQILIF
ncbi:hypothetical protein GCM10027514_34360 [Azotobacter armeniacus]